MEMYDGVEMNENLESNILAGGKNYCYLLKNHKWFQNPVPCKGQLGICILPEKQVKEVDKQLVLPGLSPQVIVGSGPLNSIRARWKEVRLFHMAVEKSATGDPVGALKIVNELLKKKPSDPELHKLNGSICHSMGNFQGALICWNESLKTDPDNWDAFLWRGQCNFKLGNFEGALVDGNKSLEIEETPETFYFLGEVFEKMNQWQKAAEYFKKACDFTGSEIVDEENVE